MKNQCNPQSFTYLYTTAIYISHEMFSLQKKLKNEIAATNSSNQTSSNSTTTTNTSMCNNTAANNSNNNKRSLDLRQKLLQKEFEGLIQLPVGCSLNFDNPDILYLFKLNVTPDRDSLWYGGKFEFTISVPEGYLIHSPFSLKQTL